MRTVYDDEKLMSMLMELDIEEIERVRDEYSALHKGDHRLGLKGLFAQALANKMGEADRAYTAELIRRVKADREAPNEC